MYNLKTTSTLCNNMSVVSRMAYIDNVPKDPVDMFSDLLEDKPLKLLNMATVDEEYGVLNRIVVFRGLTDRHITFVTENNSRKWDNIMKNPKVAVTYFRGPLNGATWQVRMWGEAKELNPDQITKLWNEETVFAKIRSRICECGKPVDYNELKKAHDTLLEAYKSGKDSLPQTETYTAFKIVPTIWDFYKSEINCIADRVQYRKADSKEEQWNTMHVAT